MKKKRNIFRHFFQIVRCLVLAFPLLHVCFNVVKNLVQDTKYDVVTITDSGEVAVSQSSKWGKSLNNAFVYSLMEEQFSTYLYIYFSGSEYDVEFLDFNAENFCSFVDTEEFKDFAFDFYYVTGINVFDLIFTSQHYFYNDGEIVAQVDGFYNPFIFTRLNFSSLPFNDYFNFYALDFDSWVYTAWLNYYLNYLISLSVILLLPEFVLWFIDSVRNYGYKLSDKLD